MESVFEHTPSKRELRILFLRVITSEEYLSLPLDLDGRLGHIYRLYMLRGDEPTANLYLNRIVDPVYRRDLSMCDLF
jgi:hypothetical protein